MRRLSFVVGLIAFTTLGCDDHPVSVLPTTPGLPGVASITLSGPETIAPGQSVQLVVSVRLADGTTKLVGSEWTPKATEPAEKDAPKKTKGVGDRLRQAARRIRGGGTDGGSKAQAKGQTQGAARKATTTPRKAGGS